MTTTIIGRQAEAAVSEYLYGHGFKILKQNYRTKVCEIDIVAQKDKTIYFVEVKYRSSDKQGDGLEYITAKKLKQLHFAAQIWIQQHDWDGDYRLVAVSASTSAKEYLINQMVELN